jgi:hypothetical protein
MDMIFWLGLALGAILSFAASLAAFLVQERILKFLTDRKLASQSNRFKKAAEFHELVTDLHTGNRDKHIYMSRLLIPIIVGPTTAFMFMAAIVVLTALKLAHPGNDQFINPGIIISAFTVIFMMAFYAIATERYRRIMNALDGFDEFDTEFRRRWAEHLANQQA